MHSLGKIGEDDLLHTARGTNVVAGAAARTFLIIDSCQIVFYHNRATRADLFALLTANARIFARFAGICALVGIAARNYRLGLLRNRGDDVLGADGDAKTAAETQRGVYVRYTVHKTDGARGTGGGAERCFGAGRSDLPFFPPGGTFDGGGQDLRR